MTYKELANMQFWNALKANLTEAKAYYEEARQYRNKQDKANAQLSESLGDACQNASAKQWHLYKDFQRQAEQMKLGPMPIADGEDLTQLDSKQVAIAIRHLIIQMPKPSRNPEEIRALFESLRKSLRPGEHRNRTDKNKATRKGTGLNDCGFYLTEKGWVAYKKPAGHSSKIEWYRLTTADQKKVADFFNERRPSKHVKVDRATYRNREKFSRK